MTRPITLIAIGGIVSAVVCLPAAAMLHHHTAPDSSWSWSDHSNWVDDDDDDDDAKINGKGDGGAAKPGDKVAARDFAWGGGDRLELNLPGNVHFRTAPDWHLSIRASERTLDHLRVDGGRIELKHSGLHHVGRLEIELSGPALRDVELNGSGKLAMEDLKQDRLSVEIHGSGSASAAGSVDTLNIDIMGSGSAAMQQLAAQTAKISIEGSGDADVAPIDTADVFIAGSGDVRLHSRPAHLKSRIAGSGNIVEQPAEKPADKPADKPG